MLSAISTGLCVVYAAAYPNKLSKATVLDVSNGLPREAASYPPHTRHHSNVVKSIISSTEYKRLLSHKWGQVLTGCCPKLVKKFFAVGVEANLLNKILFKAAKMIPSHSSVKKR